MHDAESPGAVFVSEMSRYEVVERECASEAERTQQSGTAKTGLNKGLVTEQKEVQIPRASPHFGSLSFERVAAMKWCRRRIEKNKQPPRDHGEDTILARDSPGKLTDALPALLIGVNVSGTERQYGESDKSDG